MGEAKEAVIGGEVSSVKRQYGEGSIVSDLDDIVERIDHAIEVKEADIEGEGQDSKPENHFKVGCLRAAKALVRRAEALLEDYGTDLDDDINPLTDLDDEAELEEDMGDDLKVHPLSDDSPWGPEDLPDWCKIGNWATDPDGDGPWRVIRINWDDASVTFKDNRKVDHKLPDCTVGFDTVNEEWEAYEEEDDDAS